MHRALFPPTLQNVSTLMCSSVYAIVLGAIIYVLLITCSKVIDSIYNANIGLIRQNSPHIHGRDPRSCTSCGSPVEYQVTHYLPPELQIHSNMKHSATNAASVD